jgi:hypothetical protein
MMQISNAGELSGMTQTVAHITPRPVPVVAAYNQLHKGLNEDWQHVQPNETTPLPIDLLVTLPGNARSSISLRPSNGTNLEILGDETPIGTVTESGVPIKLKPRHFGPGFARLGIVRFDVTGGITTPSKEEREEIWSDLSRFLAQNGITVVIAEEFGNLIITEMKNRGIECVGFRGTSEDAVKSIVHKKRQ